MPTKIVRVFCNGVSSPHDIPLRAAIKEASETLNRLGTTLQVEEINNKLIRENSAWTLEAVIDWLLGGQLHIMTCQGMHMGMMSYKLRNCGLTELEKDWSLENIYQIQLLRLEQHAGFPYGLKLRCPVFQGDKWRYIEAIGDYALPTFKILLPLDKNIDLQDNLKRYVQFTRSAVVA